MKYRFSYTNLLELGEVKDLANGSLPPAGVRVAVAPTRGDDTFHSARYTVVFEDVRREEKTDDEWRALAYAVWEMNK